MKAQNLPSIFTWLVLAAIGGTAAVFTGCQSAKFVRTDETFVEQKKATPPQIFVEQKPPRAFKPVGIIQLAAAAETPEAEVASEALATAQNAGCDVLVSRRLTQRPVDAIPEV